MVSLYSFSRLYIIFYNLVGFRFVLVFIFLLFCFLCFGFFLFLSFFFFFCFCFNNSSYDISLQAGRWVELAATLKMIQIKHFGNRLAASRGKKKEKKRQFSTWEATHGN